MILRTYQNEAVQALRAAMNSGNRRPLVCLPTGSGKTPTSISVTSIALNRGHHVVVAVHTKELIEQIAECYEKITGFAAAVYSASLRRKEVGQFTVVQIQSVAKVPGLFDRTSLLIVDECDRIPMDGEGQYRSFIAALEVANPKLFVAGFTATPYRMGQGLVYGPGKVFTEMVYDAGIKELIAQGFLSPLRAKDGGAPDLSQVHIRQGEYVASELEAVMADSAKVQHASKEIVAYGKDRRHWILFVAGTKHGKMVETELLALGVSCKFVTASASVAERDKAVDDFKSGNIKALINIVIFSVGFDHPGVDLIADLAPTKSPGRYYQKLGRGLRIAPGKTDCLVLDYAGNIAEHGPIDTLNDRIKDKVKGKSTGAAPMKSCPECHEIVYAGTAVCPNCKYEFPKEIAKHAATAHGMSPISSRVTLAVGSWLFSIHQSKDASRPDTLKVQYFSPGLMPERVAQEFLPCDIRHNSFMYKKFISWLEQIPLTTTTDGRRLEIRDGCVYGYVNQASTRLETAIQLSAFTRCLTPPNRITTMPDPDNNKYTQVIGRDWK